MSNPYRELPDYCFWSRTVAEPAPWQIDPVVKHIAIGKDEKVATMGSCFAQHIARHIQKSGLNYFVPESAPDGMSKQDAVLDNYGVFSARYGNVYTVRQALQLFERAYGKFDPKETAWQRGDRLVDAFRPQIQPAGFESAQDVKEKAALHLEFVGEVFGQSNWLVFTLGLTEAWRSKLDGAVYPTAPGVAGGDFDPARHEFVNFTAREVRIDLFAFIRSVRRVNPGVKILLTVSPVPLIATHEMRHVLVSTAYSKAALRVAADEAERQFEGVVYFPSYEIITSPATAGRYYADDLRNVVDAGVEHVMRVFSQHFIQPRNDVEDLRAGDALPPLASDEDRDIICDEEEIERSVRRNDKRARL